jgi:NitT/TauT family transport system substrate-binding protein
VSIEWDVAVGIGRGGGRGTADACRLAGRASDARGEGTSETNARSLRRERTMATFVKAPQRADGLTRRDFLGRTLTFTVAACATCRLTHGSVGAQGRREIKFSHGSGLCNMPLFYAAEKKLFAKYGIDSNVVLTGWAGDQAIQLATGRVEMGVIPYTNAIAAYTRAPSFAVVSGSGTQGLIVVAKPAIKSFADIKGKKIGTFQADTLDIIVYDYLKKNGLTYKDVQMQYLGDSVELTNAFIAGQLDVVSAIEPYATKARTATHGNVLGDGTDIYGKGYPDCVLIARKELIEKEPKVVKDVIRVFFEAEVEIESNFEEAAKITIGKYYKTDMTSLMAAAQAQPPGVDIRNKRDFMFGRAQSMKELNYISKDPDPGFVNFSLLEEVIKENPELWQKARVKSV